MSRTEYMRELDALLQGISKEEREEAMQYYNDYFDDAGSENEEKVIEELGSPAKLADTIRAGVNGNTGEAESYGEYGERGYRDCRFDTSESPARRDGFYKDSHSEYPPQSKPPSFFSPTVLRLRRRIPLPVLPPHPQRCLRAPGGHPARRAFPSNRPDSHGGRPILPTASPSTFPDTVPPRCRRLPELA